MQHTARGRRLALHLPQTWLGLELCKSHGCQAVSSSEGNPSRPRPLLLTLPQPPPRPTLPQPLPRPTPAPPRPTGLAQSCLGKKCYCSRQPRPAAWTGRGRPDFFACVLQTPECRGVPNELHSPFAFILSPTPVSSTNFPNA